MPENLALEVGFVTNGTILIAAGVGLSMWGI